MPKLRQIGHVLEGKVRIVGVYKYINHKNCGQPRLYSSSAVFLIIIDRNNEKMKKFGKLEKYRAEPEMQPYYTKPCKACNKQIENRV